MHDEKYTNVYIQNQGTTQMYSKATNLSVFKVFKKFNYLFFLVIFMDFFTKWLSFKITSRCSSIFLIMVNNLKPL